MPPGGVGGNPSDVGLHVRHSPLHQAASTARSRAANPIYSPGDGAETAELGLL